jgi:hypothetical protein
VNFAADKTRIIGGVLVVSILAAAIAMIGRLPSQTSTIYTNRTFGFLWRRPRRSGGHAEMKEAAN